MSLVEFQHANPDRADMAEAVAALLTASGPDALADAGWWGVGLAEEYGGSGGDWADRAVAIEAIGAAVTTSALPWTTGIVATLLSLAQEPPALTQIAGGELPLSIPAQGVAHAVALSGGALSGQVLALGEAGWPLALPLESQLFLVRPGQPGVEATPVEGFDITRPWSRYHLHDVRVAEVVHIEGLAERWRALAGLTFALDSVGTARTALEQTVGYAAVREQFGRPIGSFQAYKHQCADSYTALKLAQSLVFRAAETVAADEESPYVAASVVEAMASATTICARAVQLHGGIGFSWESGIHRFLRRTRANELLVDRVGARRDLIRHAVRTAVPASESPVGTRGRRNA